MVDNNNTSNNNTNDDISDSAKIALLAAKPILGCGMYLYSSAITAFVIITYIANSITSGHMLGNNGFGIFLVALRYTFYELVIFILPFILLKMIIPDTLVEKRYLMVSLLIGIVMFAIIMTPLNRGWVLKVNWLLDKSKGTTYYIKVLKKYDNSRFFFKEAKTQKYYISFNSWWDKRPTELEIYSIDYDKVNEGEIYTITSYKGYYGFEYTKSISFKKVDGSRYPEDTVFPLTQEEAEKVIQSKESQLKENDKKGN